MKQSLLIGIIVFIQLTATFTTQLIIIRVIGVGAETDSYMAAQAIPAVISAVLMSALQSVWLPRLSASSDNEKQWRKVLSIALGQGVILAIAVIVIIIATINIWINWLFPVFTENQLKHTNIYIVILSISALFTIQSAQLTIALRTKGKFYLAESINAIGIIASLIVVYWAAPLYGLFAIAVIALIRSVIIFSAQMLFIGRVEVSIINGWKHRETWHLMKPIFLGASLYKTSPLVDRYWASQATSGGLTILNLAQTGIAALATILDRSVCVPIITRFGWYIKQNDYKSLLKSYRLGLLNITIISIVYVIVMWIIKEPFVLMLQGVLNISIENATLFWTICLFLVGYMHVAASGTLPVAVFHALGDTQTPVVIAVIGFVLSLIAKSIGFIYNGLIGLVLATSLYYLINLILVSYYCERKIKSRATT